MFLFYICFFCISGIRDVYIYLCYVSLYVFGGSDYKKREKLVVGV